MKRRFTFLALFISLTTVFTVNALTPAVTAFHSAPRSVLPMLDATSRLDMIDYYNSSDNKGASNTLGGKSRVTAISPYKLDIAMTDATTYSIAVIPAANDTLIALITTVATPAADSKISFYQSDWTPIDTKSVFTKPVFEDWLNTAGKKNRDEVESTIPFLLTGYSYDPATLTLTITNNSAAFMPKEIYEMVSDYVYPSLTYKFNGKKFAKVAQ